MRSVFLIVALTLTACSGKPLLLGGGAPCAWAASHAERAEAQQVTREAVARGRTPDEVEMAPVQAGQRIPDAGRKAFDECRVGTAKAIVAAAVAAADN